MYHFYSINSFLASSILENKYIVDNLNLPLSNILKNHCILEVSDDDIIVLFLLS